MIREDEADIRISINGKPYFESWATADGGDLTATAVKTRRGGMGNQTVEGGVASRNDGTFTIQWDDVVAGFHNELESLVGHGAVSVGLQMLNHDKTPIPGAHFTRTGVLTGVLLPKMDANSTATAPGFYQITAALNEAAA